MVSFNFYVLWIYYFVSSFSWLLPYPLSLPPTSSCYKPRPPVFEIWISENADVWWCKCSHVEASFMCIEARESWVHLNAERIGWLCSIFRFEMNLLHILSLSSPGSIFLGNFHDVVFKRGSHENIQDWVEAAVEECNTLCDLDGNIHALAHVTVSDQGVDDVYGLAELWQCYKVIEWRWKLWPLWAELWRAGDFLILGILMSMSFAAMK